MGKSLDAEFYNCDTKASSNQKRVLTSLPDDEKKIFIAAEREFVQAKKENRNMKKEDFNSLKNLAQRGYAKAAYYVGVCAMQHGNFQKATEYLCAADNAGDRGAAKLLGDCSYYQNDKKKWTEAFGYYAEYGAEKLETEQKIRIMNILNQPRYVKQMIKSAFWMIPMCLLLLVLTTVNPIYHAYLPVGILALLAEGAVWILAKKKSKENQYDFYYELPLAQLIPLSIYLMIRFLF